MIAKNSNTSTRVNGMIEEDELFEVTHPEILENEDWYENDGEDLWYTCSWLLKIVFLF